MVGVAPFEIIVGPAEIYFADVGTAFPDVDTAPGAGWTLLGTGGDKNISEEGVMIRLNVTSVPVRVAGSVMPRKQTFTEKSFQIEAKMLDMSPEVVALALGADDSDIVDVPAATGTPGTQTITIPTDSIPTSKALIVRCEQSSEGAGFNTQFNVFNAFQVGNPEMVFKKGDAVGLGFVWEAVEMSNGDFVNVVIQDALALS